MTTSRPAVRILILTSTGSLVLFGIAEFAWLWAYIGNQTAIGADLVFFQDIARRWLETGEFYLDRQLAGPYEVETLVDVLYPPNALLLFVPFVWLPWPLWWIVPIGVFAASIARLRPAPWTWPLIVAGIVYPPSISQLIYGNTNTWVVAAIAAATVWSWPGVLVLLKPSLAPFALVGIRSRRWWMALVILAAVSLLFGSLWLDYVTAMQNSSLTLGHGLQTWPLMLVPLVAWAGRRRGLGGPPSAERPSIEAAEEGSGPGSS